MSTHPLAKLDARIFIPDRCPLHEAAARITNLGVGAHPDDLEFMAFQGIAECFEKTDRWFGGVICTDGRGSPRRADQLPENPDNLAAIRYQEQIEAAKIGKYGLIAQLGYPSKAAIDPADPSLRNDLYCILQASRPDIVYTHNPADKHRTHIGVFAALLHALRRLLPEDRPRQLIGCEVWRDLDWLPDDEKIRMDVTGHEQLAKRLNSVFASQISGGKRYDLAVSGRRAANATFHEPREGDHATQVLIGIDLTPLIRSDSLDPVEFMQKAIRRFEDDVASSLSAYF